MKVDMKFEVAIVPVSDVDRSKAFYTKLGFRVDDDIVNGDDFRVVQLTPPNSAASVTIGKGVTDAKPGSFRGGLIVSDIVAAHKQIAASGIEATEVFHGSAIDRIASFAVSAQPEHLRADIRQLFKRNILDSLGCAIAGLQGKPFQALREQFDEYRAPGRCTLIGGGKTSADQAALFNSSLVRYVDLLDSYMAIGGLCHRKRS
jgi:glycerate-2-kinase